MLFLIDVCDKLGPIISVLKTVFVILQWVIPIILILFGAIDLGKAVIASKEDEMKKAQGTLIKRIVYALVIFFLFTIVNLVIGLVADKKGEENTSKNVTGASWAECWKAA